MTNLSNSNDQTTITSPNIAYKNHENTSNARNLNHSKFDIDQFGSRLSIASSTATNTPENDQNQMRSAQLTPLSFATTHMNQIEDTSPNRHSQHSQHSNLNQTTNEQRNTSFIHSAEMFEKLHINDKSPSKKSNASNDSQTRQKQANELINRDSVEPPDGNLFPSKSVWMNSQSQFAYNDIKPLSTMQSMQLGKENYMSSEHKLLSNAQPLSQSDFDLFSKLYPHYNFELLQSGSLSDTVSELLISEGCAICLKREIDSNQIVFIHCRLLHCKHVTHAKCLRYEINTKLDSCHSTSFYRMIAYTSNRSVHECLASDKYSNKYYTVIISVLHHISNACVFQLRAGQPIRSQIDSKTGVEYLQVNMNSQSSNQQSSKQSHSFSITRGKLLLRMIDLEQSTLTEQGCNFDLSTAQNSKYMKLVLVDAFSNNVLTFEIQKTEQSQFSVESYRYEWITPSISVAKSKFEDNNVATTNSAIENGITGPSSVHFGLPSVDLIHDRPEYRATNSQTSFNEQLNTRSASDSQSSTHSSQQFKQNTNQNMISVPNSFNSQSMIEDEDLIDSFEYAGNHQISPELNAIKTMDWATASQMFPDPPHPQHAFDANSPLFLPKLPTFPVNGLQLGPQLYLTIDQVRGNVARLAKTHSGSRFLQQRIESHDPQFMSVLFSEISTVIPEMMCDNFGHFVVEKLILNTVESDSLYLLQQLSPVIGHVSCQKHGSFSVQALVDQLQTQSQISLLCESFHSQVERLLTHASGHFCLLRMLSKYPLSLTKFIDDAVVTHMATVATDHHGLRIIKAILSLRRPIELTRLFKQVAALSLRLAENQYGNYALQAVLDCAPAGVRTNIKVKCEGKYMRLSKQKFSSNVVEKCLRQSSAHWRNIIIKELIAQPAIAELLRDRYGNYVLQTALQVSNPAQVQEISRAIAPYLSSLRENVRSKWRKLLSKAGADILCDLSPDSMISHQPFGSIQMSSMNDNPILYNQSFNENYSNYQNNENFNNTIQSYNSSNFGSNYSTSTSINLPTISNSINGFPSYRKSSSHKLNPLAEPVTF